MDTPLPRDEQLLLRMREEFPTLRIVKRRSDARFATTVGSTIYVPSRWDTMSSTDRYVTLRHELMHVRQFHHWPFGPKWKWLNHVLVALAYLFVLPLFWTLRAKFEREGYTQTMLTNHELGRFAAKDWPYVAGQAVELFAGSAYFWMWTRGAARAWALDTLAKIESGEISNEKDRVP